MKARDMRDMTVDELLEKERNISSELFNLRFQLATNQLENPMRLPLIRKDLARVKTLLGEKSASGEGKE
ncbi:MAG TPA: 50S ribosomal protein L29 [Proteobacteria bacterium]|nr:50S ribosomal protein L29 [bacterium BMS3Abin14]HDL54274.1 50S ribosomal protein L29 [Pseudomonadota bacterium]